MGPDTWDAAWAFTCQINSGLTILPSVNLVSNIGFGTDASHTLRNGGIRDMALTEKILPMTHPPYTIRDSVAEKCFEEAIYGCLSQRNNHSRLARALAQKAKRFYGRCA
jgi:hypothetical protein